MLSDRNLSDNVSYNTAAVLYDMLYDMLYDIVHDMLYVAFECLQICLLRASVSKYVCARLS